MVYVRSGIASADKIGPGGLSSSDKTQFKQLRKEWEAQVKRDGELQRSREAPDGAQAVMARAEIGTTCRTSLHGPCWHSLLDLCGCDLSSPCNIFGSTRLTCVHGSCVQVCRWMVAGRRHAS